MWHAATAVALTFVVHLHCLLDLFVDGPYQAQQLGTSLSASFDGFGADEKGRLSAKRLHGALNDIGQFRWTTVSYSSTHNERGSPRAGYMGGLSRGDPFTRCL